MKKNNLLLILLFFFLFSSLVMAKTQQEEYKNDYLYSEAYFDYLIECAENDKREYEEKQKEITLEEEIQTSKEETPEAIVEYYEPFKLKIEKGTKINPYGETFKKVDSKTIIPMGDKFNIVQNMTQSRNKYNSNDYRILMGSEYTFNKYLGINSGLETNYRGLDQNPTSRKVYLSPVFRLGDKVTLNFHNKMNIQSYSTDHDLGLNVSPFKSKVVDFGVYAGLTRNQSGSHSESINFSTNLYFF